MANTSPDRLPAELLSRISAEAACLEDELIAIRRAIHAWPEPAFEEVKTAARVQDRLRESGFMVRDGFGGTGFVALVEGREPGPTIGIRGDMDCLPIHEETGLPYASERPGFMHACGHDVHTTIALGCALVLQRLSATFRGRAAIIFQPAEEVLQGAQRIVDDGLLDAVPLAAILGYHNAPGQKVGEASFHPDVAFASADAFDVTIRGRSGHAAHPHHAIDPVSAAAYFITQLQTVVSREVAPHSPAVVTVGRIQGGTVRNQIPDAVTLSGTIRTQSDEARQLVLEALPRLLDGIRAGMRVGTELTIETGSPVMRNEPSVLATYADTARSVLGADRVTEIAQGSMGSEDFAVFTKRVPGAHLRLGSAVDGVETALHRSDFAPNEAVIRIGVAVVAATAMRLLEAA